MKPKDYLPKDLVLNCLFCGKKCDIEYYSGLYGCDTGCEYIWFEVYCPSCHNSWRTGEFGSFEDMDEEEILEDMYYYIEKYNKVLERSNNKAG